MIVTGVTALMPGRNKKDKKLVEITCDTGMYSIGLMQQANKKERGRKPRG